MRPIEDVGLGRVEKGLQIPFIRVSDYIPEQQGPIEGHEELLRGYFLVVLRQASPL
jgi:hypothetical protein